MNVILFAITFSITLFMYLHIQYHLKTCEYLELITIYTDSKYDIEFACETRQPTLIYSDCSAFHALQIAPILQSYHMFDINVRNIDSTISDVSLPFASSRALFEKNILFSEKNNEFLTETGLYNTLQSIDYNLRPNMVISCSYDILFGSKMAYTPFRYDLHYRNFWIVTEGSVTVKLSPPHNKPYFYTQYDYDAFEFYSKINPWNPQPEHAVEFSKAKCLEIKLEPNCILFIPPYWWYSFQLATSNTCIISLKYDSIMSKVATSPYSFMRVLQLINTKYRLGSGDAAKGHAAPFDPWLSEAMPEGGLGFTGGGVTPRPQKPPAPAGAQQMGGVGMGGVGDRDGYNMSGVEVGSDDVLQREYQNDIYLEPHQNGQGDDQCQPDVDMNHVLFNVDQM